MKPKHLLFCLVLTFCVGTCITVFAQAVNKQDSLAIVDLYNSTKGPNWTGHTNWLTKKPLKTWSGITVTGTRVTSAYLKNNNLNGKIPSSIGNLTGLTSLYLSINKLSGTIPSSIGNLVNLQRLNIGTNQLTGSIPSSLGNLVNLTFLSLNANKLSGEIPSTFANLTLLSTLDVSSNRYTFTSMEFIQQTFPFAEYTPQAPIPVHQHGNTLAVSVGAHLKNNTYKWFRVGQAGSTTIKGDSVFHPSQNGKYFTNVTNSVAYQLTLTSDTINYVASAQFVEAASASSENALQQYGKTNFFSAYPNPAKDILHVQSNGKATLALLNQSGQTLLTTNGEGSINIRRIQAGVYYLKNRTTGATLKIAVVK